MALDNLITITFTPDELAKIDDAMSIIEDIMKNKAVNLTPDERRQYGSIADKNKIIVDKIKDYIEQIPQLIPPGFDKAEFDRDYATRGQIESRVRRMKSLQEQFTDTKTLLDHDNYQGSMVVYRFARFLASTNTPGTSSVYEDLKQHHTGKRSQTPTEPETPEDE